MNSDQENHMIEQESNPYSTPESELSSVANASTTELLQDFPRISAWAVSGLAIITLGTYYVWWMYSRTGIINRSSNYTISKLPVYFVLFFLALSLGSSVLSELDPYDANPTMATNVTNIIYSISSIFWMFVVRNRIHQITRADALSGCYMGGILTFFFQVLYMQYRINVYKDAQRSSWRNDLPG